ncbi:hypothetical protein Pcinc_023647 [Petrolisthes cinctipes]|uniref:Uncharacterized protein n=1 Tax=Petrolisthes cinctipes TaxID=88211 RepID=A0AAE1FCJ3_PETCI|nr:hypothetical protein Pcinc_023647 [Petrolisthes cinctipes]
MNMKVVLIASVVLLVSVYSANAVSVKDDDAFMMTDNTDLQERRGFRPSSSPLILLRVICARFQPLITLATAAGILPVTTLVGATPIQILFAILDALC